MDQIIVGNLLTADVTKDELAEIMVKDCIRNNSKPFKRPKLVFSSNGQGVSLSANNGEFKKVMDAADIIHADGMSVVFASWLLGNKRLREKVTTTDFFHNAARKAESNDLSFFMLGASEELNKAVCDAINKQYPKLRIVGRHHGYFDENEDHLICEKIRKCQPDVLWVALGKPKQEFWSFKNSSNLGGVAWIKTCGGLYSFLTGEAKRAPIWMQSIGLEWLHRLLLDPRRLFKRYLITNIHSLYLLLRNTRN